MAEIEVKGYVNKPSTKEGTRGKFGVFTLASSQKEKDGTKTKVYYDCVYFAGEAPPESAFVTVKGWFSVRKYPKKDGSGEGTGLAINVQHLEVAPKLDGSVPPKDDFGL